MTSDAKTKIMLVFGTRPDAIKMCPLVNELRRRSCFEVIVCVTGQHRQMLDCALNAFKIMPDIDLSVMREDQSLTDITVHILTSLTDILASHKPDIVLIHGDTSSALAAALACFYQKIPVGHVEAGLRTYNLDSPYPEEFNRQAASLLSRWHFAPTVAAGANLIREGKDPERVFITGNTIIDALRTTARQNFTHPLLDWAAGSRLAILTAHRRETQGKTMRAMFGAIRRAVCERPDVKLIYPVHKSRAVRTEAEAVFADCPQILLTDPLDPIEFHNLMSRSCIILTDSGGIQEEATCFGIPTIVLRNTTERPEGITAGTLLLAGTDEEPIYRHLSNLLDSPADYNRMRRAQNPYGDGHACRRIADILERER